MELQHYKYEYISLGQCSGTITIKTRLYVNGKILQMINRQTSLKSQWNKFSSTMTQSDLIEIHEATTRTIIDTIFKSEALFRSKGFGWPTMTIH